MSKHRQMMPIPQWYQDHLDQGGTPFIEYPPHFKPIPGTLGGYSERACCLCGKHEHLEEAFYMMKGGRQYKVDHDLTVCPDCYENGGRNK